MRFFRRYIERILDARLTHINNQIEGNRSSLDYLIESTRVQNQATAAIAETFKIVLVKIRQIEEKLDKEKPPGG